MDAPPAAPRRALWTPLAWVGLCLLVGLVGNVATSSSVRTWYPTLDKPAWTPPGWVFGPVWTALYVAMGLAAARVQLRGGTWRGPLALFLGQLALNGAWSWLFFGMRSPLAGLLDIGALLVALVATTLVFRRVDRVAAALLLPYLLWVAFATALNAELFRLNG